MIQKKVKIGAKKVGTFLFTTFSRLRSCYRFSQYCKGQRTQETRPLDWDQTL